MILIFKAGDHMKLPNGYGSVTKMKGNRRNPYRATVTERWIIDKDTSKSKQIRKTVGYYSTKSEALQALAEYNASPYDLDNSKITFDEVYERWSDEHFPTISASNVKGYQAAYLLCEPITRKRMVDIKLDELQYIADHSGKNEPTLRKFKVLLSMMFRYAVIHDIIPPEMNKSKYVNIKKAGNPNKLDRKPFTKSEIEKIWSKHSTNDSCNVILMMIYTGCRISELLDLKKENVNIKEHWFDITASKTESGIRKVPIADKVLPFFEYWYNLNDCDYLLSDSKGNHYKYDVFYNNYWKPLLEQLNMQHTPHDTRHTCVSLLAESGVDDRLVKKIVGHKGQSITQIVYTHFEIQALLEAINKI